jgi:hypothetical protein
VGFGVDLVAKTLRWSEPSAVRCSVCSSPNKLVSSALIWRSDSAYSYVRDAGVEAASKQRRGLDPDAVEGFGAHHRQWSQGGAGACHGGRRPTFLSELSILLVEGRLIFFLLARVPDGRQRVFGMVSMAASYGGLGGPSGPVPGAGEISAVLEMLGTRLQFLSEFWGPFCLFQGLVCNLGFFQGPVLGCVVILQFI